MPDEHTAGHPPPEPGTGVPPRRATSTAAGSRPAGRAGAHRRSV